MPNDYIPRSDEEFDIWQENLLSTVLPNIVNWNIPQQDYDDLLPLQTNWDNAWDGAKNKDTRSSTDVQLKDDARAAYESVLRKFVQAHLAVNRAMSDADRQSMGLTVRDTTPTPVPVPTTHPVGQIDSSQTQRHTIKFSDQSSSSRGKPEGVANCEIHYILDNANADPDEDPMLTAVATRSNHVIDYKASDSGKRAYYYLRWVNTRGQGGPWAPVISGIVT